MRTPGPDTIGVTDMLAAIRRAFPKLTWERVEVRSDGFDHLVLVLDDSLVLRAPKTKQAPDYFDSELALLGLVHGRSGVAVPQCTHVSREESIIGYPLLKGDPLSPAYLSRLSPDTLADIATKVAGFLSCMHALDVQTATAAGAPSVRRLVEYAKWLRKGLEAHLTQRLTRDECRAVEEHLARLERTIAASGPLVVLHADLGLDHILHEPLTGRVSVIDFSDAGIGDRAFDFGGLCGHEAFARAVLAEYSLARGDESLLDRARLYWATVPVSLMIDACLGYHKGFDEARAWFRRDQGLPSLTQGGWRAA